jgi:lipopolysaccharide transport system permease protein
MIEEARKVVYWGSEPNWTMLAINMAVGLIVCAAGFAFFQKTKICRCHLITLQLA